GAVREVDFEFVSFAGPHRQVRTVNMFDGAADARRLLGEGDRHGERHRQRSAHQPTCRAIHHVLQTTTHSQNTRGSFCFKQRARRQFVRPAAYIGGVRPLSPTETLGASSVPSGCLMAATMKILAPGLSSSLLPGTYLTMGASGGTMIFFSPSLYLTVTVRPSVPVAMVSTVAFIIVPLGRTSQGPNPSAAPRMAWVI